MIVQTHLLSFIPHLKSASLKDTSLIDFHHTKAYIDR